MSEVQSAVTAISNKLGDARTINHKHLGEISVIITNMIISGLITYFLLLTLGPSGGRCRGTHRYHYAYYTVYTKDKIG